jgi:c-di-GMP-binding flagellar brake protein YcgR
MAENKKTAAKKPKMTENRTVDRRHLVFYLRVFNQDTQQILGHLTDISTAGLMLVSERKIDPGTVFQARLILPKEVMGRTELPLKIICCWCRPDSLPEFHAVGFQFEEISLSQKKLIDALITEFSRETSLTPEHSDRPACNLTHTTG